MPLGYNSLRNKPIIAFHFSLLGLIITLLSLYCQTRVVSKKSDIPEFPAVLSESMYNSGAKESNSNAHLAGAITQRLPQIPLDVEQYPVAPSELELEQVHVFVRHGESGLLAPKVEPNDIQCNRGAYPRWSSHERSTCLYTRVLEYVQNGSQFSCGSVGNVGLYR